MSATITFTTPPDDYCPPGNIFGNMVEYLNANADIAVTPDTPGGISLYVQESAPTPGASSLWCRLSSGGYPIGFYTMAARGRWVPVDPPQIGSFMLFNGDPTGVFDANGLGYYQPSPDSAPFIAGPFFGWQVANGNNGSQNFRSRFPLCAQNYDVSIPGWFAQITQQDLSVINSTNGGHGALTLNVNMLPNLLTREYDSAGTQTAARIYAGTKYSAGADAGVSPRAIGDAEVAIQDNYPPYRVAALLQFIGYLDSTP